MRLCDNETYYLLSPKNPTIDEKEVEKIYSKIKKLDKPVVLDLQNVNQCVNKFFVMFKKLKNLKLVNVENQILSTIFITGFDRYVKIYGEEISLAENKRELINRRLHPVR